MTYIRNGQHGFSNLAISSSGKILCLLQREPESRARSTFLRMKSNLDAIRTINPETNAVCLASHKGTNASGIKYLGLGLPGFGSIKKGFLGTLTEVFGKNFFRCLRGYAKEVSKADTVVFLEAYGNLPFLTLAKLRGRRTVCDFQNCETDLGMSIARSGTIGSRVVGLAWMLYGWLMEEGFLRFSDLVVVPSDHDRENLRRYHRGIRAKIKVIPNVLPNPPHVISPSKPIGGKMKVAFISSADYRPNWEACLFIVNELAPRLTHMVNLELILAGGGTENLRPKTSNVRTLGYVKDLDGLLKTVQIGISPVFSGAGTSYKVLMYLCAGLVVVGSSRSMRGIDSRLIGTVPRADSADEFVSILERIYANPEQYLGHAAERSALARELYTVGPHFVDTWRAALGQAVASEVKVAAEFPIPSAR